MCRKFAVVLGRILMAAIFILSGVSKLFNWSGSLQHLESTLSDWHAYLGQSPFFAKAISMAPLLLGLAIAFELIGGCSVLIGYRPKWGAVLLILFLIPTTILMHHFWFLEGQARVEQQISFIKNCAILGGLMILWASNMDKRRVHY
ncbi:MAG: DoxX family protein [Chlamydiales bacterium]|nr:DoxX family protein [Chlamydiales bacterium]